MNKQTIVTLEQAYRELIEIPVKGVDTARMAKALSWIENVHTDLIQELKKQEPMETEEEK